MIRSDWRSARILPMVLLCLLAMAVAVLETAHTPPFRDPMEMGYVDFTRRMAAGEGMSTRMLAPYYPARLPSPISFWPPFYPATAAVVSKLGVPIPQATRIVSIIAFGLSVALLWLLGSMVFDRQVGTISALLLALWPPVTRIANMALSENLFVLLLLLSAVVSLRLFREQPQRSRWYLTAAAAGLAMGGAALTRYAAFALIPIGAAGLILNLRGRSVAERLGAAATWSVCAALPAGLFLVRNLIVTGAVIGSGRPPDREGTLYHVLFAAKVVTADGLALLWRLAILPEAVGVDSRAMALVVLAVGVLLIFGLVRSHRVRAGLRAAIYGTVGTPESRFLVILWVGYWASMLAARSMLGFMSLSTRMMMPAYALVLLSGVGALVAFVGVFGASARRALAWAVAILVLGAVVGVVAPKSLAAGGPRLKPGDPPPWVTWVAHNTPPGAPIIGNAGFDYTFYLDRPALSFASFLEYRSGNRFDRDCRQIAKDLVALGWGHSYLILRAEDGGLDPEVMGQRYGPTIKRLLEGQPSLPVRQMARYPEFVAYEILSLSWTCE